jgi:hypothetical protein
MAGMANHTFAIVHVVVPRQPGVVELARRVARQAGVDVSVDLMASSVRVRFAPVRSR